MGWIRLLLALSVVVTHADAFGPDGQPTAGSGFFGLHLVGGQAAVQAFYVISGFYMALVLNRKYAVGAAGYRTFIAARVLRLFPAYLVVLLLTILLAATQIVPHPAWGRWRSDFSTMNVSTRLLYAGAQATLIGQDAVWFSEYDIDGGSAHFHAHPAVGAALRPQPPAELLSPSTLPATTMQAPPQTRPGYDFLFVGQAWTLGVELLFYCVAPLIVRRPGRIAVCFFASWAVRLALVHFGMRDDPWSYRFFPSELATFLMGSAAYHVYAALDPALMRKIGRFAWPAMVLIVLFLFQFHLSLRALIVAASMAASLPFVFALTKDWRRDRWIGELSYPVYVTHETVRLALVHYVGYANVYALIAATLVASVLLMLGVEQPFERMRARFVERRRARVTSAAQPSPSSPAAMRVRDGDPTPASATAIPSGRS